jgi:hypothetical protein
MIACGRRSKGANRAIKATRMNKRFACGTIVQYRHGGRRPAINVFDEAGTAGRGCSASANHDDERTVRRAKRFGCFWAPPEQRIHPWASTCR